MATFSRSSFVLRHSFVISVSSFVISPENPMTFNQIKSTIHDRIHDYRHADDSEEVDYKVAKGLGWASIAIGLSEILFTRPILTAMGLEPTGQRTGITRAMGVREIMQGVDILSHEDPTPGVWARVAGDMLDGVLLAGAARKTKRPAGFAAITGMVLGVVAADMICAPRLSAKRW